MYISRGNFHRVFDDIKKTSLSHSTCKLIIFVACLNVDALCSAKIFTSVLKKDLIQYQIIPIVGYTDLKSHYEKIDSEISNIILLGCGSMVDLESFFELEPEEFVKINEDNQYESSRKIYVIDGHKPWNLDNLFGSHIVTCLDEGYVNENLTQEREAYVELIKLQEDDDQEDDNKDDDDDDDDDQSTDNDDGGGFEETDEDEDDELTSSQLLKRKRKSQHKAKKRHINQNEKILEEYYASGTTISVSVSLQVYTLLSEIGETNTENLWLTIIGTISLDNQYPEVYKNSFDALKAEVARLNPTNLNATIKNADSLNLSIDTDYYLFLLRHWSLYDSFFYSNFVNAKLSIWREDGRKQLHKMFAKMGISLQDCKQNWLYMNPKIKHSLNSIFSKNLKTYGLEDLTREGFLRTYGFRGSISASECVESILALLEHDNKAAIEQDKKSDDNNNRDEDDEEEDVNELISRKEKIWISNFWSSWDALDNNSMELINKGLDYAKDFQKFVFNTGMAVLEKRIIKNLKVYRLAVLKDLPDIEMFKNPLILTRLGNWLLECCAEYGKNLLPLVLASLDERTDTYLVVGLAPRYPRGGDKSIIDVERSTTLLNTFSVAFQQVASSSGAKVRIDSFESTIMEIRKDDLAPFLEKLTLSGLI
ncbi:hypothetical protein WICMUC_001751 [Wickerhamomyces mucosus]|uniref:Cell division control protein 45 n=1 Tax=Wickerhamomyces mucosus TaxID=1378264 RepID=A0A9P8PSR2_9ASCO|nr:hypothetical protein WICMUC_001751 [Wickerhamomyces mucosus]